MPHRRRFGSSLITRTTPRYKRVYTRLFGRPHTWSKGPLVMRAVDVQHGEVILEIGARGGVYTSEMAARGAHVVGIDINARIVGYEIQPDSPLHARMKFMGADALYLPFRSESFDKVVMCDCLEHLQDDTAAIREIARVLKPDGMFIATLPTIPGYPPHRVFSRLLSLVPKVLRLRAAPDEVGQTLHLSDGGNVEIATATHDQMLQAFGHYRHYDEASTTALFENAGLHVSNMRRFQMLFESEMMHFEFSVRGMRLPLVYPFLRAIALLDRLLPPHYPGVELLVTATREHVLPAHSSTT